MRNLSKFAAFALAVSIIGSPLLAVQEAHAFSGIVQMAAMCREMRENPEAAQEACSQLAHAAIDAGYSWESVEQDPNSTEEERAEAEAAAQEAYALQDMCAAIYHACVGG